MGIDHQLVAADITIVFDDEGVAQLGVEVFFCGRGGDGLTKNDFHGGSHSHFGGVFINVKCAFVMTEKTFLVECGSECFLLKEDILIRDFSLGLI